MKPLKTGQLVKVRYIHNPYFNHRRREKPMTKDELAFYMTTWNSMQDDMDKAILSEMSGIIVNTTPVKPVSKQIHTKWSVAKTTTQEYKKMEPQRLAIILEEAEEIDMDLYHKCWVLPHEGVSWDGEFWFKREELEIIQQEEELQSAHQA